MNIDHEFLSKLIQSETNLNGLANVNFKETYLDYDTVGFSGVRALYNLLSDFYLKYRKVITGEQLETFIKTKPYNESQTKDILLLFESVKGIQTDKSFDFLVDTLKNNYATHLVHVNLDKGVDLLLQNKIGTALQRIKEGIYSAEEVLQEFSDEGSVKDSILTRAKLYSDIKHKIKTPGLHTGFPTFDVLTGGLKPGELVVVMSGSSEGKSTYLLNVATHTQLNLNKNVLFVSLELPKSQLERRYDSLVSGLICNKLRDGTLDLGEEQIYKQALAKIHGAQGTLYIIDRPIMSPQMVASKIIELESKIKFDLIVVDYLSLMQADKPTGVGWQDISNVALALRALARNLKVPLLTAMQVKQESMKQQSNPKYGMTDIALSFAVIFHSDTVLTLKTVNQEILNYGFGTCELTASVSKCRDGSRGGYIISACFDRMKLIEQGPLVEK